MNLLGANPSLETYAKSAEQYGLRVTSGRRPGSVTSTGGTSYHASGDALDVAGPADRMRAFFNYARSTWGSQLEELIYTPGGTDQIKNGRPYTYTGSVAADHYDHVHIADTAPAGSGSGGGGIVGDVLAGVSRALPGIGGISNAVQSPVADDVAAGTASVASELAQQLASALGINGPRILLETALIIGGALITWWGAATLAGVSPTAPARLAAAAATKGAVKA